MQLLLCVSTSSSYFFAGLFAATWCERLLFLPLNRCICCQLSPYCGPTQLVAVPHNELLTVGHYFTTSAAANQKQIDAETRAAWPQLSREQKKQELKPEKNRNHFKRMWKKDLQIKVGWAVAVHHHHPHLFCIILCSWLSA